MKASAQEIAARTLPASLSNDDRQYIKLAARFLREQGAKRVWLFGSLAKGRRPTVHSDFDFAVEGLPGDRLFGSVGHLLQILPRPVDIVELEDCNPLLREQILKHGIIVNDEILRMLCLSDAFRGAFLSEKLSEELFCGLARVPFHTFESAPNTLDSFHPILRLKEFLIARSVLLSFVVLNIARWFHLLSITRNSLR
jgi:predicted nucleotidyltransferase